MIPDWKILIYKDYIRQNRLDTRIQYKDFSMQAIDTFTNNCECHMGGIMTLIHSYTIFNPDYFQLSKDNTCYVTIIANVSTYVLFW